MINRFRFIIMNNDPVQNEEEGYFSLTMVSVLHVLLFCIVRGKFDSLNYKSFLAGSAGRHDLFGT